MKTTKQSRATTSEAVREIVTETYIATGRGMTVKEIAAAVSVSETTIRAIVTPEHGIGVDGIFGEHDARPSFSTSYSGFQSGVHRVYVYEPTSKHLAAIITKMRNGGAK